MKRFISAEMARWKSSKSRKPLILRGARQVGKTWIVRDFAKQHFPGRLHMVDLEKYPDWHRIFEKNLDVKRIVSELELVLNASIEPGRDLLFIDEIQSCPRAIMALRYFFEELPQLHVITAGSLMEFALKDISFPVGRIQFINMYPMTFAEFLLATGNEKMSEVIEKSGPDLSANIHQQVLDVLRLYFFVGGMPECVKTYRETEKLRPVIEIQSQLIDTYRADFSKYAPHADKRCINMVLTNTAKIVGQQIKYSRLADGYTPPTNKKAFDLLQQARVLNKITSASPAGVPLGASATEKKFKALLVDIGLMQNLCGMNFNDELRNPDLLNIYNGSLAEQFVGQELLAYGKTPLHYWSRDAKSSTAEVDFLVEKYSEIYPVEVKSGVSGKLRSLHLMLNTYPHIKSGFVFSSRPYSELTEQKLIFYPLYYAGQFAQNK